MSKQINLLKIGCGKFFYGKNAISQLAPEIIRLGGKAFLIGGPGSVDRVMNAAGNDLKKAGAEVVLNKHPYKCTRKWAEKYARMAKENGCTVIVGVGGGLASDQAKAVLSYTDLPIITVPTSIATCAPTSIVAVMYKDDGKTDGLIYLNKEIDVCIADHDLIGSAPKRLLASGILDSMAKLPEGILSVSHSLHPTVVQRAQISNAESLHDFLTKHFHDVYDKGVESANFDDYILSNLLHTSLISGFASGSGQLALAHAIYNGFRDHFTEESKEYYHGEMVAVGVLVQMLYNGDSLYEVQAVEALMRYAKMPLRLTEIGFVKTPKNMELLHDVLIKSLGIAENPERISVLKAALDYVI